MHEKNGKKPLLRDVLRSTNGNVTKRKMELPNVGPEKK
jgi:hypothetical protein